MLATLDGYGHALHVLNVTSPDSAGTAFERIDAQAPGRVLVIASCGQQVHLGQRADVASLPRDTWLWVRRKSESPQPAEGAAFEPATERSNNWRAQRHQRTAMA